MDKAKMKTTRHMLGWIVVDVKQMAYDLFVNRIASSFLVPRPLRYLLYRTAGFHIQTASVLYGSFFHTSNIKIGRRTFINHKCYFENNMAPIEIGDHCSIAMEVMFCTATHHINNEGGRAGEAYGLPINIKNRCWIGTRAVILPGVTVGEGCVIAAGSVVNKNCEPNGVYAGVPARRIRDL